MSTEQLYINGKWGKGGGERLTRENPADGDVVYSAHAADQHDVDAAFRAAEAASKKWRVMSWKERVAFMRRYQEILKKRERMIAELISEETGKPLWEAKTEAKALAAKVEISIQAYKERCRTLTSETNGVHAQTRYMPHGPVAVFGPFNFPCHLPNGHIVPALLAGNTVVFKPSERAPACGAALVSCMVAAGLPKGVINLVQGQVETGKAVASHPLLRGLFFTGSSQTGHLIHEQFGGRPEVILALEMGGNNPLVVWDGAEDEETLKAIVLLILQSALITAGQRCTCARRLILPKGKWGDRVLDTYIEAARSLRIGLATDRPEPFYGPLIDAHAAEKVMAAQSHLIEMGGETLLEARVSERCAALVSPGVIGMDSVIDQYDEEIFGPLLQVYRANNFDQAIRIANYTRYGLSAALVSRSKDDFTRFSTRVRAGIINWNRQTTGAVSAAPFGGVGASGNHRPSAYFAADYCAYPVASVACEQVVLPVNLPNGVHLTNEVKHENH